MERTSMKNNSRPNCAMIYLYIYIIKFGGMYSTDVVHCELRLLYRLPYSFWINAVIEIRLFEQFEHL